uniref:Uncharacterized protein n=1 Tax=Anguilla anguilla TaxID=7936 RepID=A0A0E9TYV1_ANGAN
MLQKYPELHPFGRNVVETTLPTANTTETQ